MLGKIREISATVYKRIDSCTLSVLVVTTYKHKIYKKFIKKNTKFIVHDEVGKVAVGDVVKIVSTKPYSKRKTWKVLSNECSGKI